MSDFPNNSSTSGNPTYTVDRRKKRIGSTDPRNNALNNLYSDTFIIDDSDTSLRVPDLTIEDISTFTLDDIQETLPEHNNLSPTGVSIFSAPENLSIDTTTFRVESSESVSGDGNIYFTATLNFDDILGAAGYEYIINASD
jgi:hypothetical protein